MTDLNLGVNPSLIHDDEKFGKIIKFKLSKDESKIATLLEFEFNYKNYGVRIGKKVYLWNA